MKLKEIIQQVDKSKRNEDWIDITVFDWELDLQLDDVDQDDLKAYWVADWCCTDTKVGMKAYFLKDEFVAISYQSARKSDENFEWVNQEAVDKVREFLVSLKSPSYSVSYCNMEAEAGDGYKISYNDNIQNHKHALLNGESVEILERIREKPDYGIDQQLIVRLLNGEEQIVHINDLYFPFRLKAE